MGIDGRELKGGRRAKRMTISPICVIAKEKRLEGKAGKGRQLDTLAAAHIDR